MRNCPNKSSKNYLNSKWVFIGLLLIAPSLSYSNELGQSDEEFERTLASANEEIDDSYIPEDVETTEPESENVELASNLEDVVNAMIPKTGKVCRPLVSSKGASYYSNRFNGKKTASGAKFSNKEWTAAHPTLPFGTILLVTNPKTGANVEVTVNDRGPFKCIRKLGKSSCHPHPNREIDLSQRAFTALFARTDVGRGLVDIAVCE